MNSSLPLPKVSIIIPTYNRKHLLEPALTSVFKQTYSNTEIIVVDDCSTDGTSGWIEKNYPAVNLISLNKNRGAAGARNVGIEAAKGEYIAFLDSDDYWNIDYLEKSIEALSRNLTSSFAFCNHREIKKETDFEKYITYKPKEKYRDLIHRSLADVFIFTMSVVIVRTSAIQKAGLLNEALYICHDRELYIRLLEVGDMIHIPQSLVTRVMHSSNISSNYKTWAKYVFLTLDTFFSTPASKRYKDLEARIRRDWALVIAREIWQKEKNIPLYFWMIMKAFKASPQKTLTKIINRIIIPKL